MNDQSICGTNYEGELEIDQESRMNGGENEFDANLVEVNIEAESNIHWMENQNVVEVEVNQDQNEDETNLVETNVENVEFDNIVDEADLREGNVSHIEVDTHEVNIEADSRIVGEVDTHDDNVEANLSHVGEQVGINIGVEGVEAENIQEKNIESAGEVAMTSQLPAPASPVHMFVRLRQPIHRGSLLLDYELHHIDEKYCNLSRVLFKSSHSWSRSMESLSRVLISHLFTACNHCSQSRSVEISSKALFNSLSTGERRISNLKNRIAIFNRSRMLVNAVFAVFDRDSRSRSVEFVNQPSVVDSASVRRSPTIQNSAMEPENPPGKSTKSKKVKAGLSQYAIQKFVEEKHNTLKNAKKNLNSEFAEFVEGAALHESPGISSIYQCQNSEAKIYVETEMAIKHLRHVRNLVINSTDVDLQSKRLLDAVIDVSAEVLWFTRKEEMLRLPYVEEMFTFPAVDP
nr:uncharacterized protein LOC109169654 isoform X2 [Ipomoea batatas]